MITVHGLCIGNIFQHYRMIAQTYAGVPVNDDMPPVESDNAYINVQEISILIHVVVNIVAGVSFRYSAALVPHMIVCMLIKVLQRL